ncbi:hypothetical protein GPM53_002683 [Salmonella enterica]|nr:hypothetical protein [Salmonella enterica subsp. enterica serovar Havana]EDY4664867.1 hypothetical protein [Salmonella enterica]EDZ1348900.1 hypothetical protein [Salmonella enterica]EEJ0639628.1 hypothetical protein [Salmonella enterica]EEJ5078670.1 hypothetical protein [Salmonella enterica]
MQTNTRKVVTSDAKWHPHLGISFIGCLLAITLEIYFEERIFIPHSGGVSFGLIVLLVINMVTIIIHIPRKSVNCILLCILACILTIAGLFIAYPVGR